LVTCNPLRTLQLLATRTKARNPKQGKNRSARSKSAVGAGNRGSRLSFLHRNSPRWSRGAKFFGVLQPPTNPSSACHQDRGEKTKKNEKKSVRPKSAVGAGKQGKLPFSPSRSFITKVESRSEVLWRPATPYEPSKCMPPGSR
jgi:hypothetical protein